MRPDSFKLWGKQYIKMAKHTVIKKTTILLNLKTHSNEHQTFGVVDSNPGIY